MYGGGRVGRRFWDTSAQGVLLMRIIEGQGPVVLSIGVGRVVLIFF